MKRVKWVEGQFGPKYLGEYRNNFGFIFFSSIIGNALALNSWSTLYKVVKAWPGPEAY